MHFQEQWQKAVTQAVLRHSGLDEKAFKLVGPDLWTLQPHVLRRGYSSTERLIVGLLVHLYAEMEVRLPGVDVPNRLPDGIKYPSQLIWEGAPAAAKLFLWLDGSQQRFILPLLDPDAFNHT